MVDGLILADTVVARWVTYLIGYDWILVRAQKLTAAPPWRVCNPHPEEKIGDI